MLQYFNNTKKTQTNIAIVKIGFFFHIWKSFFSKVPQNKAPEAKKLNLDRGVSEKEEKSAKGTKAEKIKPEHGKHPTDAKGSTSPVSKKRTSSPLKQKNVSPPKCEEDSPIKVRKRVKRLVIESDDEDDTAEKVESQPKKTSSGGSDQNHVTPQKTKVEEAAAEEKEKEVIQSTLSPAVRDNITVTPEKTPGGFYNRKTAKKSILGQSGTKRKVLDSPDEGNESKKSKGYDSDQNQSDVRDEDKNRNSAADEKCKPVLEEDSVEEKHMETEVNEHTKNSTHEEPADDCSDKRSKKTSQKKTSEEKKEKNKKRSPKCRRSLETDGKSPVQKEKPVKAKDANEEKKPKELGKESNQNNGKSTVQSFFAPKSAKTNEVAPETSKSSTNKQGPSTQEVKR
ncbi:hypothetical protein PoB_000495900 [Plakobranchus ocellatus]|uniref:Uncharacterized protein n=1 Tax=Plakobranchus ocellatus TaxID=259542 RepID=A0AAV3Y875_9GAST|nr:hypothetical protein PoB_000495900 [Plakobranchus ocellatus]